MYALLAGLIFIAAPADVPPGTPNTVVNESATKATEESSSCADVAAANDRPKGDTLASAVNAVRTWAAMNVDYVLCEVERDNVDEVMFLDGTGAVARLADGGIVQFLVPEGRGGWFAATLNDAGVPIVASKKVDLTPARVAAPSSGGGPHPLGIITALASVGLGGFLFYRWRRNRPGRVAVQGVGSGSRHSSSDIPSTRFSDVAGCQEAIEDLAEIVDVLRHPERFRAVGARTPKGALLSGPPGTGKTLLARAVAGEAGVPFFSAAGSDFVEMYVGVGARRVRDVFERARKAGGGIVFIDEIDAVGRKRSDGHVSSGEGETENTLISLLNELDGFRSSNVVVLAATNRPDVLDPALLRPGRLDRRIHVGLPDLAGRTAILQVHTRGKPMADDVNHATIAGRTPGMSGAQLEQICNEAALLAARDGRTQLRTSDFTEAVEYVVMGRARRSAQVDASERLVTAWHEAGHAVCAMRCPGAEKPVAVSIVPRGAAGGVTWMAGSESQLLSRAQLQARLVVALGGRVAEELHLGGEHTAGAANDLEQASSIARMMVDRFGMTERGLTVRAAGSESSEAAVEGLLQRALQDARSLLDENRALLDAMVSALLDKSDLDQGAIDSLDITYSR